MTARIALILLTLATAGCVHPTTDYTDFLQHHPRSILVLPPINETTSLEASTAALASVTEPLAEHGYYVFPVGVVERMMKANGLPTPGDMHAASIDRLRDVFGADAALYITVQDWSTKYLVIASMNTVAIDYELVDLDTGQLIWESHGMGEFGVFGLTPIDILVIPALHAGYSAATEFERKLAPAAHRDAINRPTKGNRMDGDGRLLKGPRHPDYEQDRAAAGETSAVVRERRAKQAAKAAPPEPAPTPPG